MKTHKLYFLNFFFLIFPRGKIAVQMFYDWYTKGQRVVVGNPVTDIATTTGIFANVYGMAQLSGSASGPILSNNQTYPYFSRLVPSAVVQVDAVFAALSYYSELSVGGPIGWNKVAVICTADNYGLAVSQRFIAEATGKGIEVVSYQQYINGATDVSTEVRQLQNSGARVFVAFTFSGWPTLARAANSTGIIGNNYVWILGDAVTGLAFFLAPDGVTLIPDAIENTRGAIGTLTSIPQTGAMFEVFKSLFYGADPAQYPGIGPNATINNFPVLYFDLPFTIAEALKAMDANGVFDENGNGNLTAELWTETLRSLQFEGASGLIAFGEGGNRIINYGLFNWLPERRTWVPVGTYNSLTGLNVTREMIWNDNTTNVPDLDIRPAFNYWSCHSREEKNDPTGKQVKLHRPDGDDVDEIDIDYHCDQFIDCKNFSDESVDCGTNYLVLFIVFGVITGVLILGTIPLFIFTLLFGFIIKRRRIRAASPPFLIIILVSTVIGYASVYAWFGKPHPVACGFQPWLLGLSVTSLVAALVVRCFRIYRIFKFPLKKTTFSNFEVIGLWALLLIPALIILFLWTLISTPTATMVEKQDDDHYICYTGGFTGYPGGYVFFGVFVAYDLFLVSIGAILTFLTRNVPSLFNESKLIAVSIYNLLFLSIIVIPVFIVLQEFNPFIAWIIRTLAILYAFLATSILQFSPLVYGLVIVDKFKNSDITVLQVSTESSSKYQTDSKTSNSRESGSKD